jgi:hypothetical protein
MDFSLFSGLARCVFRLSILLVSQIFRCAVRYWTAIQYGLMPAAEESEGIELVRVAAYVPSLR